MKTKIIKIIASVVLILIISLVYLSLINYFLYHNNKKMLILTWHRVVSSEVKEKYFKDSEWIHDVKMFEQQIKYLHDEGYKTLSLDEYYDWYNGKVKYDTSKTCVITFDDGTIENYYYVLPILKKYNFKATVFIVGSYTLPSVDWPVDTKDHYYLTDELIEKMRVEYPNFEIQNHTYDMHRKNSKGVPVVSEMGREEIVADFEKMEKYNMKYLAYPHGYCTKLIQEIANEKGYNLAFGFTKYGPSSRKDDRYNVRRVKVGGNSGMLKFKWNLRLRLTNNRVKKIK